MSGTLVLNDAALSGISSTLKTAAARMQTLSHALRGMDDDVAGADPLIEALPKMQEALAGRLALLGASVDELSSKVTEVGTTFHAADQKLAQHVSGGRREAL